MQISQSASVVILVKPQNNEAEIAMPEILLVLVEDQGHLQKTGEIFREGLKWKIPGGRVEAGETVEAAAVRELKEEAGLKLAVEFLDPELCYIHQIESARQGADLHQSHYFLVVLHEKPKLERPNDPEGAVRAVDWFKLDNAPSEKSLVQTASMAAGNRKKLASLLIKTDWYLQKQELSGYEMARKIILPLDG